MANCCWNSVVFYGDGVQKLIEGLKNLEKENVPVVSFSTHMELLGCPVEMRDYSGMSYDINDDHVIFYFDTAWNPFEDEYSKVARHFECEMCYLAEECGCGVYVNTDTEHKFFDAMFRVYIDDERFVNAVLEKYPQTDLISDTEIEKYYSSEEELVEDFKLIGYDENVQYGSVPSSVFDNVVNFCIKNDIDISMDEFAA